MEWAKVISGIRWRVRIWWEGLLTDRRIAFTYGHGGEKYTVNLKFRPFISTVYETLIFDADSLYAAQQIAQRGNLALKRWAPYLLRKDADLPGVGFQYSKPEVLKGVQ